MAEQETIGPLGFQRVASAAPWAVVAVILIVGGMAGHSTRDKVIGVVGAVLVAAIAFRAARLRLLLGEEVVVVGWLGSKHYAWSEIDTFAVNNKGLAIRLSGGLEQQIPAFPMGAWMTKKLRDSMRADLEATLARAEKYRQNRRRGR